MEVYCVYLADVFIKSFKTLRNALTLSNRLVIFLFTHDMDIDMVRITKEVM